MESRELKPLRVLFVEDTAEDVELGLIALRAGGFQPSASVVQDDKALRAALAKDGWDIVIADYRLPGFDGIRALRLVRELNGDLPFILVSGTVGEELAVEAMRLGAHDYVLKGNLARLPLAVKRELREAELRSEKRRDEQEQIFLSNASAKLAESLNYEQTLSRVAELAVPQIADFCAVDVLDELGELRRVAMAHADPEKLALAKEQEQRYPVSFETARGLAQVIQSGLPEFGDVTEELLRLWARDAEHLELLRKFEMACYMTVPLVARGSTLGAVSFASSNPRAPYGQRDVEVALELGRRAGMSVDNARLYARAQGAIRLRDDFLSIASHELKTPLTALQLRLQSLQEQVKNPDFDRSASHLSTKLDGAVRSTSRLAALIESLLDVSRIAQGRMKLNREHFDLREALADVIERFREEASRAGSPLIMRAEQPLEGNWDRLRVEQIVVNLLANALKYGPGQPVELRANPDGEDTVEIEIEDRGIGIADVDLKRIFGRFERAVSLQHYGGLGLGLYISRQIVEAHGGSIDARSAPGRGATFRVRLPMLR
jgi:signal transduction histidine kinase/FixJ family two-component response regulator